MESIGRGIYLCTWLQFIEQRYNQAHTSQPKSPNGMGTLQARKWRCGFDLIEGWFFPHISFFNWFIERFSNKRVMASYRMWSFVNTGFGRVEEWARMRAGCMSCCCVVYNKMDVWSYMDFRTSGNCAWSERWREGEQRMKWRIDCFLIVLIDSERYG